MALDEGLLRRVVNASLRDQKDFFLENETKEPLPGLRMKQNRTKQNHTLKSPGAKGLLYLGKLHVYFQGKVSVSTHDVTGR